MPSSPQSSGHPLDQNFGSDQRAIIYDLDNSHGHHLEDRITDLENAFQSFARDNHTSRIFQADLEQRIKQIEARLDAMGSLYRNVEGRLRVYDKLAEDGRRIAAIEKRIDLLERRHQGCSDVSRRQGTLSRGIPPVNTAFVQERGPPIVGRRHFGSGRKRQRDDGEGQGTGNDGDWLLGSEVDLIDPVQNEPEQVRNDRVPFCTTLAPRTRSLDLQ